MDEVGSLVEAGEKRHEDVWAPKATLDPSNLLIELAGPGLGGAPADVLGVDIFCLYPAISERPRSLAHVHAFLVAGELACEDHGRVLAAEGV